VREFATVAAKELGISVRWDGKGRDEVAIVVRVSDGDSPRPAAGQVVVRVDPRYFRPTEIDSLVGDSGKAKAKLGWEPRTKFGELVSEMIREDLALAQRDRHLHRGGFKVPARPE